MVWWRVSIRDYVKSMGGTVGALYYDDFFNAVSVTFILNNRAISVTMSGKNSHELVVKNVGDFLFAHDYDLQNFFYQGNTGTNTATVNNKPTTGGNTSSQLVTLEQLDAFKFFMGSTEAERSNNLKELNRVLEKYEINTSLRLAFFMGNIYKESRGGARTLESFSGNNDIDYFNEKYCKEVSDRIGLGNLGGEDGSNFRGSGYIQITGRYNYTKFAEYTGDPEIIKQGYRLVGGVYNVVDILGIGYGDVGVIDIGQYAWESAGWFWKQGSPQGKDLNLFADKKDYNYILSQINKNDTGSIGERNKYINEFYKILTGSSLGLPE